MGEVSSDTPQAIGERLAQALVEQCADLGGTPFEFSEALRVANNIIQERVSMERHAAEREAEREGDGD